MDTELLWERARIIRSVRAFFDSQDYLEVDTPILAPALIPETCLEVFETSYIAPPGSRTRPRAQPYWLVPSPEIWMKRLIADHRSSAYQICKCFRNGESTGRLHSPEFTMLEYYTLHAGYEESVGITEDLFRHALPSHAPEETRPPFIRITMEEAFSRWAGFPLYEAAAEGPSRLEAEARRLGLDPPPGMGLADLYNLIFVHAVELSLPKDRPVVLMDYPAFVPCLAKKKKDGKTNERWELYVRGIELANCYTEEGDPEKVRSYMQSEGEEKARKALVPHRADEDFWKIFRASGDSATGDQASGDSATGDPSTGSRFPPCSGVAMGLDRFIMAATGRSTIDSVLPFPM